MNVNLDRKLKVWYLHSDNKRMSMISSRRRDKMCCAKASEKEQIPKVHHYLCDNSYHWPIRPFHTLYFYISFFFPFQYLSVSNLFFSKVNT